MANENQGPCRTVGHGGVGESGASCQINHQVTDTGSGEQLMIIRRTESSLCPNTAAVALLVVNGETRAHGAISGDMSSIQTTANVGDRVSAIVHTVPLFNDIVCVRLGELEFDLDQCDLVS